VLLTKLFLFLISFFLIIGSILYLFIPKDALYSFIVAYISSLSIIIFSFKTYKDMVNSRLQLEDSSFDDRDIIDKIDDKFNLYDNEQENLQNRELKDIIKAEKEALKANRRSIKETLKDSAIAFNYKRLIAYLILVVGFFALLKSKNLVLTFYLPALILPNILAIFYLINFQKIGSK